MERGGRPQPRLGPTGPTGIAAEGGEGAGGPIYSGFRTKTHAQLAASDRPQLWLSGRLLRAPIRLGFRLTGHLPAHLRVSAIEVVFIFEVPGDVTELEIGLPR